MTQQRTYKMNMESNVHSVISDADVSPYKGKTALAHACSVCERDFESKADIQNHM